VAAGHFGVRVSQDLLRLDEQQRAAAAELRGGPDGAGRCRLRGQRHVETVCASLRSLASEKGLDFVISAPADLAIAYGETASPNVS